MGTTCSFDVSGKADSRAGGNNTADFIAVSQATPPSAFIVTPSTPLYACDQVGGKAYNLLRLNTIGVYSPPFMVISAKECYECFKFANRNFEVRFNQWVQNPETHPIQDVRDAILQQPVSKQVEDILDKFLAGRDGQSFAIRSSFNDDDGTDSVFAGLFETYLHVKTKPDILKRIVECWLSCLKEEAASFYSRSKVRLPEMAVIVMEQLASEVSGVLFQANPVTGSRSTTVISASYGQGDGVNGGLVPADEWWINNETSTIRKRVVEDKHSMVSLADGGGTVLIKVPETKRSVSCLTDTQVLHVVETVDKMAGAYHSPQDVEFAFVGDRLSILQTRPISTFSENIDWTPPNPQKTWHLYAARTMPMTPIYASVWARVWSEGLIYNSHLMGNVFKSTEACMLNGFGYFSLDLLANPDNSAARNRMQLKWFHRTVAAEAKAFWEEKRYNAFLREWEDSEKVRVIKKHRALTKKHLQPMADMDLAKHFDDCYQNMLDMFNRHVMDSMQSMAPVAWFVAWVTHLGVNVTLKDAFMALEGHSPITEGLHGEFPELFHSLAQDEAYAQLQDILKEHKDDPDAVLTKLCGGVAGARIHNMILIIEYRLLRGYDPVNSTLKERPDLMVSIIVREVDKMREKVLSGILGKDPSNENKEGDIVAHTIRSKVPENKQAEFDSLLAEARSLNRLRDERALYTDLTAAGVLHHCMMEIGRRVHSRSFNMGSASLILYASYDEVCALLASHDAETERSIFRELRKRREFRRVMSIRDAPKVIGKAKRDLTMEDFPSEFIARSYLSNLLTIQEMTGATDIEKAIETRYLAGNENTIHGLGGSNGVYQGRVVVLHSGEDIHKVKSGDVVVTQSTSSLINMVLPFAGALVTDFGAMLSHAAICAREARIPCVLGTKVATALLEDGMTVKVDGTLGMVELVGSNAKLSTWRKQASSRAPTPVLAE